MTNAKPSTRRPAAGVNLVITAASLSLTLGGWALLTANDQAVSAALATQPAPVAQAAVPPSAGLDLPALPTVVPPRAGVAPAAGSNEAAPVAVPRSALPRRVAPPPAPAARTAPLPRPVARTRSSR